MKGMARRVRMQSAAGLASVRREPSQYVYQAATLAAVLLLLLSAV